MKKIIIFILFVLTQGFHTLAYSSNDDLLKNIYDELKISEPKGQDGVTYSLTYNNSIYPISQWSFFLFPGTQIWGMQATKYSYYDFDTAHGDNYYGLPYCNSNADCKVNTFCERLESFSNTVAPGIKMCVGMADKKLDRYYNLITSANHYVDITTLAPFPDERFKAMLENAVITLAKTGKPVTIRILDGIYGPPSSEKNAINKEKELSAYTENYLNELTKNIQNIPNNKISIYISSMRTCSGLGQTCSKEAFDEAMSVSFNHSKITDVDGEAVITGGANYAATDYLTKNPNFDLMGEIVGPAASSAIGFTNMLWSYVNKYMKTFPYDITDIIEYGYVYDTASNTHKILKSTAAPMFEESSKGGNGQIEILAVGRTGGGILPDGAQANSSDLATYLMLKQAKNTIYVGAQSLNLFSKHLPFSIWPFNTVKDASGKYKAHTNLISAIASLIINGGNVYIVKSPYSAVPAALNFASNATKEQIWSKVKSEITALQSTKKASKTYLSEIMCHHLHIADIRFNGSDNQWGDGSKIFNHYKFLMVDDHIYYLGSQNFYPSGLQNYGYIVDDKSASTQLKNILC